MKGIRAFRELPRYYPLLEAMRSCEPLGSAGGYSGARFWRILSDEKQYCLRRWPREHPDPKRLQQIHQAIAFAAANVPVLPVPIPSRDGPTFVKHEGHFWELTEWMPGDANYLSDPSTERLRSAFSTLAQLHLALADSPWQAQKSVAVPDGIMQREKLLFEWKSKIHLLSARLPACELDFSSRGQKLVELFKLRESSVEPMIRQAQRRHVPIQACVRDIWHDHVLFVDQEVSGVVDFGAMRLDSVACDIARLRGSLVGDHANEKETALAAYSNVRPLSEDERSTIEVYDAANVLMSGLNWLQWMVMEGRHFDQREAILQRLDGWIARNQAAL